MGIYTELYPVNNHLRHAELLDGLWRFQFDPQSRGEADAWPKTGLPESISMPVPASFSDVFTDARSRDYAGDFWYETAFCVKEVSPDKRYFIRFGSAYFDGLSAGIFRNRKRGCCTWNGRRICRHDLVEVVLCQATPF